MTRIFIPALSAEDWQRHLADPDKHWKPGYSARATAYCWQEAHGFPLEITSLLQTAPDPELHATELLIAIPEYKVFFPPMRAGASQNDVFALGKTSSGRLVSITVEAKVSESFDRTVAEWKKDASPGKLERLDFLVSKLGLAGLDLDDVRYQLLHRLSSAIIEAEKFNATYAIMIVQSFSRSDEWFDDYADFLGLFGAKAAIGQLVELYQQGDLAVFSGWARGDQRFLAA